MSRIMENIQLVGSPRPCACPLSKRNFKKEGCLGLGAESATYAQCDHVARKVISPSKNKYVRRSTQREIDVFLKLGSHPRILEFYDHIELKVLFLRYHHCGDLHQYVCRINEGDLPRPSCAERWQWALDVAQGLAYIHSENILHQDLSAPNVLMTDDGQHAVICDFEGFFIQGQQRLHGNGSSGFTRYVNYDPPSPQQDHFALGCIAFLVLHGRIPHSEVFFPDHCLYEGDLDTPNNIVKRKYAAEEYASMPEQLPEVLAGHIRNCWQGSYTSTEGAARDFEGHLKLLCQAKTLEPWQGFCYLTREELGAMAAQTPLPEESHLAEQ